MKKNSKNLVLPPSQSTLKYGSKNPPWPKGLSVKGSLQKLFYVAQNLKLKYYAALFKNDKKKFRPPPLNRDSTTYHLIYMLDLYEMYSKR